MKIAVLKLGARLVFGDKIGTSGGTGEAVSLIEMLSKADCDVTCYTKLLKSDPVAPVAVNDIEQTYDSVNQQGYDALVVVNGTVNFFGGAEDRAQIMNYNIINNFNGPVVYLYCDPNLPLKQIWSSIEKKPWSSNWNRKDIEITRDIHVISQSYNLDKNKSIFESNGYKVASITQYPFQMFPMMRTKAIEPPFGRNVDISYGGTFRSGRREKKLIDFYWGYPEDISVEVFGKIKLEDFNAKKTKDLRPPLFTGAVDYSKMIAKMSDAKYHVVIGDNMYPDFDMISQRTYEAIMAGCVVFLDQEFDKNKRVFPNLDFFYVKNREDVISKIKSLDGSNLKDIAKSQYDAVGFNEQEYCDSFAKLIKDVL